MFGKMVYALNTIFACRCWEPEYNDKARMRRWHKGRWEYRAMTDEEAEQAYAWWAMK